MVLNKGSIQGELIWWLLGLTTTLTLSVSGYLFASTRDEIKEIRERSNDKYEQLSSLSSAFQEFSRRLERIENKIDKLHDAH